MSRHRDDNDARHDAMMEGDRPDLARRILGRDIRPTEIVKPATMKVLSLTQPWASLWVAGAKRNETRKWATPYRGDVAVAATKVVDAATCYLPPFAKALAALGFNLPRDLPLGAILGRVEVVDCKKMTTHRGDDFCICEACLREPERSFGDYRVGRVAWQTGERRHVLAAPIPHRGSQGLRDLDPAIAGRLI